MKKVTNWLIGTINSGIAKTLIGFLSFLITGAIVMLIFESSESGSGISNLFQSLWFSMVTVTTVGYGDISPISKLGKIAAVFIMLIGIVYTGVLTGNITSWLVERNRKKLLGLVPIQKKEGLFLILGWKQGMGDLLRDILKLHKRASDYLVLVNNADPQAVNELRQDPLLKDLSYFSGDYTNREVLQNACAHLAEKVLVVADEKSGKTPEEIDFEAVLATIAMKRVNPKAYSIVEIIQPNFNQYFQHVDVEEIILTRFSARALVCNIALMSGLNNVFKKMFSLDFGILKIMLVDNKTIGKTYGEIRRSITDRFVIGVIENTGNLNNRKHEKMNQIQKAVSIEKAIQGLIEIKSMESNRPIFHPPPNYVVKENSSLIILDVNPGELNSVDFSNETVILSENPVLTDEEFIKKHVSGLANKADSWAKYVDMLKSLRIEIYEYANQISGIVFKNRKHPFLSLEIQQEIIDKINKLHDQKQNEKDLVRIKFNGFFEKSYDWDDLYNSLYSEGIEVYFYRNKAAGLRYQDRKYTFKKLEIAEDIATEINKFKDVFLTSEDEYRDEDTKTVRKPLDELRNMLVSKTISLKQISTKAPRILLICGWKPQLIEMLNFIISQYPDHIVDWDRIAVVANLDDKSASRFHQYFKNHPLIRLYRGDFVDKELLKKAEIAQATKVMILAETDSGKSFEEIDAQTVLAAMLINNLNKRAYKIAEILDSRYEEALDQSNVEEIYLEDEFTRIMLANGSHGIGITKVLREFINLNKTILEIRAIDPKYFNGSFKQLLKNASNPGKLVLGLLEETGNIYARKSEKIHQAQIQSNIRGQVEELKKVKDLTPNSVIIAPSSDYCINPNSKLILLSTSDVEGWETYTECFFLS
ncbi:NAD-binding protein [bacterium]|nr:NAD-binding protein [bacterium]